MNKTDANIVAYSTTEITDALILSALEVRAGSVLRHVAGIGWVEMPADYDASAVTMDDVRHDDALRLHDYPAVEVAAHDPADDDSGETGQDWPSDSSRE